MGKTQIQEQAPDKAPRPAPAQVEPETPDKQGGPLPVARTAERMASAEEGDGSAGRARMAAGMQQAVGNARVGQMLGTAPAIQAQKKETAPKKPKPITVPLPKGVTQKPTGEAEFPVGGVKAVALPDKKSKKPIAVNGKKRDAMTRVRLDWKAPGAKTKAGKVISVVPAGQPTLTLQTTYGPSAGPESKSSYGKGTTKEDIKAGKTSLGYHEGSHGEYAMEYVKDNPLPKFKGTAGMTVDEFQQAQGEYDDEMEEYRQKLDKYHQLKTDCVGVKEESCEALEK